jgi:hypothetical protein
MSVIKKAFLLMAAVVFGAMTAAPSNNSEQIVFSDTGALLTLSGNQNASSTPFGFWIWCAGAAAPGSNGGYQNANACQGSMYFYGLQTKATHVVGFATENPAGIYTMHVVEGTAAELFSGTLNPSYTCTLSNTTSNQQARDGGAVDQGRQADGEDDAAFLPSVPLEPSPAGIEPVGLQLGESVATAGTAAED